MAKPVLGILTLYLNDKKMLEEKSIYEKMTAAGNRIGITVFVFTPQDVDEDKDRIHAMFYDLNTKGWSRSWVRFPHMIFDRCRIQKSLRFQQLLAFRKRHSHLLFLNRPLRNKWTIYRALGRVPAFRAYLPVTKLYQSPEDVSALLRRFNTVYLKPINGTGGRGILRIDKSSDGTLLIQGRNPARTIVSPRRVSLSGLSSVLSSWARHGDKYIAQQGLNIKLPNGRIHDYRMLVQKNSSGIWEVTGCAGRIGPLRSITSNLHGGGEASTMNALLRQSITNEKDRLSIRQTAEELGIHVARHLEATYGALCELALDLAIDRKGQIWLLEVNPKPSREVFRKAGEIAAYHKAIVRPIEYALWLYRQKKESRKYHSPYPTPIEGEGYPSLNNEIN